ncbi:MAG TPA: 3-deoxy-D-manno-octulosonic acid transferase [Xanthobacteraceae bacterium]|jgi:3-deoxy-D-manno-octulosonic-acid transferase|nr:3-deoxy-D-manno-octulosonic acid transferase [Xanthobacteraceae bacterium]
MIVAERPSSLLRTYRRLTVAATPLVSLLLARRLKRGKEDADRIAERRGEAVIPRPEGPLVWAHGASIGEMLAIIPLIERIRARGFNILVTSGTVTSARLAKQRLPEGAIHQFIPVDAPSFIRRFLDHWQPSIGLFAESDLWPNLLIESSERSIPLILVNGRLSERSFARWSYVPATISSLLSCFDLCLAQSAADAERYTELGAPRVSSTGNLKLDVPAPPVDNQKFAALKSFVGNRPVIVAASTHPGEEVILVEAHRRLRQKFPGLLTILVPRHPERGPGIVDIAKVARMPAVLRSHGLFPDQGTDIYVADTVGELSLFYRLTSIVFVGGSLVRHGGQNPIEAAKLGAGVLHGPHVWNFTEIYAALDKAHGAERVSDVNKLTARLDAWLSDSAAREAISDAALQTVQKLGGALERTSAALEPYLMQLHLEQR